MQQFSCKNLVEYGVDEVARGCLFGRVYVAAVVWKLPVDNPLVPEEPLQLPKGIVIRDSKKMTKLQRERASKWIFQHAARVQIRYAEASTIDRLGITPTTELVMRDTITALLDNEEIANGSQALIDGTRFNTELPIPHVLVPKGDNQFISIACASIVAKVAHDAYIKKLCTQDPDLHAKYSLASNMGYGTKAHITGIKQFGPSAQHRRSFRPCY